MKSQNLTGFQKKLPLYIFNGSFFKRIDEENEKMIAVILKICQFYGKVNAEFLNKKYGLRQEISEKLLDTISETFPILEKKIIDEQQWYSINPDCNIEKENQFKTEITIPINRRFTICQKPLFFTEKYVEANEMEEGSFSDELYNPIKEIHNCMRIQDKKRQIGIPKEYLEIDFSKQIELVGNAEGILLFTEGEMILLFQNHKIARITESHPDFESLFIELESIKRNPQEIKQNIGEQISDWFSNQDYTFNENFEENEIQIQIKSATIEDFGKYYLAYRKHNDHYHQFSLNNGWIYGSEIKFQFLSPEFQFWIAYLDLLLDEMGRNFKVFLDKNRPTLIYQLKNLNPGIHNDKSKLYFKNNWKSIINQLCSVQVNDWFQILNSKLMEDDIFE